MSDRVLFPLMGLAAALMIALALVWPQGLGARSPGPFGHAVTHPASPARTPAPPPSMLSLAPAPGKAPPSKGPQ